MFKATRLRLTLLYCAVFFGIFWIFSAGIYAWMSNSLGDNYVSKITQTESQQYGDQVDSGRGPTTAETASIAGDISRTQLGQVLLILNGALLLLVPSVAWVLTGRTLRPIRLIYERQKRFVSDASHELRTPLTIMSGELELALKRKRTSREYQSAIDTTKQEVDRLQRLVDNLLALANSDRNSVAFDTEPVNLNKIITKVQQRLKSSAEQKGATLHFNDGTRKYLVNGSSDMLEQLFTNILVNALKYSGDSSTITISGEQIRNMVIISVADNGSGMTPEVVDRAFDRFYRADNSRSTPGTGLGLAISKAIVDQHKGQISINSKMNHGTTVNIELPLY
jgi:signal transduction histidine kinase